MAKEEILLQTGTNELEVLEFTIHGDSFGINVAKVKELMQYKPVQPMPKAHPNIEGVFKPRDKILTIVDLAGYLGLPPSENTERDVFIITSFNKMNMAFHVHNVESIHRISWGMIEKPDSTIYGGTEGVITGIAKVGGKMISIIDFEKIIFDISPASGIQLSEIDKLGTRANNKKPLLIAEDSPLLRSMLLESLHKAGFLHVTVVDNGQEAWDLLCDYKNTGDYIGNNVCCIITDIEMPQMDGLFLTKSIKEDPVLSVLPVIVFSSLIDPQMSLKCTEVGADAQLTKPEIGNLVSVIDELIL